MSDGWNAWLREMIIRDAVLVRWIMVWAFEIA